MQLLSARYSELSRDFKTMQSDDSPAQWQGFILGLICRGLSADDRQIRQLCAQVLNDSDNLPGTLIANVTEMALDAAEGFKKKNLPLLLPDNKAPAQERLFALSELAYGLTLGLVMGKRESKVKDPELLDALQTLNAVHQVEYDTEAIEEEDYQSILEYIESTLLQLHSRFAAALKKAQA